MGNTPFFSVITLSYNSVDSIDRTIRSLKKQSFNDFEVIFQDAGSNDGTIEKIKKNLDQFKKAHWLRDDNGIYDGLNRAPKE